MGGYSSTKDPGVMYRWRPTGKYGVGGKYLRALPGVSRPRTWRAGLRTS